MSVTPTCLAEAQFAPASNTVIYTATAKTIIDKFIATNTDSSTHTLNINIVPSGGSVGASNLIVDTLSLSTLTSSDVTLMQNQILEIGDAVSVAASAASDIVVRMSGRVIV